MTIIGDLVSSQADLPHSSCTYATTSNAADGFDMQRTLPEEDVLFGAYLVSHMKQHCENCGTYVTPQWRKGWYSGVLNHSVLLCNACGLKFHKGQFCAYCHEVYGKEAKLSDGWLDCSSCGRWTHETCEENHGPNSANVGPRYQCPDCRSGLRPTYFDRISPSAGVCEPETYSLLPPYTRSPVKKSPTKEVESEEIEDAEDGDEADDDMEVDDGAHSENSPPLPPYMSF
eukprot:TRINITY_DN1426_c0_g1_i1.p1 TRINITY_DN1426_c0_g1~~TRINITY_DN1426_c0_g1_i1.p1  ORF type:complete len:229 (+),score=23.64 TRINITY_DN1426_c0_g1_i1:332-1018(+)